MKSLILHPTDISQWYALVNEAQASTQLTLNENTESYLVFLLQRFSQRPQLLESVVAVDFLEAMHIVGKPQIERLRAVGDKSLLLCGLFPGVATRHHVTLDYYTGMGQAAYLTVSELQEKSTSELYLQLSEHFIVMQKILQAMRGDFCQFDHKATDAFKLENDSHMH
ncbi:MAG: hypothetical protein Q8R83_07320 [Legionellaceae bacterium]|nr:hypothetical protein [Legionellaceae bacterium]